MLEPIEASNVRQAMFAPAPPDEDLSDLSVNTSPWQSRLDDEELMLSLMLTDVDAGFALELPCGSRWRSGGTAALGHAASRTLLARSFALSETVLYPVPTQHVGSVKRLGSPPWIFKDVSATLWRWAALFALRSAEH